MKTETFAPSSQSPVFSPIIRNLLTYLTLALILALALAVRMHKLGNPSMWFDEQASIMCSVGHMGDWQDMPSNKVIDPPDLNSPAHAGSWLSTWESPDFHPPMFATVLRVWRDIVGEGDARARLLCVLISLASIVCLFDLVRTFSGPRPALWAAAIMALAQPQIEFAQELRGYAMWSALGLAACAAAARLLKHGPAWRRAIIMAACAVAMVLTHFLALASAAALAIWCAIWLRGRALRQAAIAGGVATMVLVIVGSGLPGQASRTRHDIDWMREPAAGHFQKTLWRLALAPACFLAAPREGTQDAAAAAAVVYILPLLLCRRNPGMLLCALWLLAGVGSVFVVDLLMHTSALRYMRFTLAAAPALYWLIADLPLRRGLKDIIPLLAVVGCAFALPWDYDYVTGSKGEWRGLADDVRSAARAGDLIVFAGKADEFLHDPHKMYEGVCYYVNPIPCQVALLDRVPDAEMSRQMRQAARVWIVTAENPPTFFPGWNLKIVGPNRLWAGYLFRAEYAGGGT